FISFPIDYRAGKQLDAAQPCVSEQSTSDCIHQIRGTVIETWSGKATYATIGLPDGSSVRLRLVPMDAGFSSKVSLNVLSQLVPGSTVTAEEWRGNIIGLNAAGLYIATSNDPRPGLAANLLVGLVFTIAA